MDCWLTEGGTDQAWRSIDRELRSLRKRVPPNVPAEFFLRGESAARDIGQDIGRKLPRTVPDRLARLAGSVRGEGTGPGDSPRSPKMLRR